MKNITLSKAVSFSGTGLHTGNSCNVEVKPNTEATGIVFVNLDGDTKPSKVNIKLVESTNRSTNISVGGGVIHTIEHLLSACSAHGINHAIIEVSGGEIPILDGSSHQFFIAIKEAGLQELEGELSPMSLHTPFEYFDEETGAIYRYRPAESFIGSVTLDFGGNAIGQQFSFIDDWSKYESELSYAKTFVLVQDLAKLLDAGLIKGGSFDIALIFAQKTFTKSELSGLAERFGVDPTILSDGPVLNASKQTYSNEPARHKLMDLIGDLYLFGRHVHGEVHAHKPSHKANVNFANEFYKRYKEEQKNGVIPVIDPKVEPLYDHEGVKRLLPHRFPFLMVDKVYECSENHVIAVKNVSGDQYFFPGHFPGNPVFPGVLQMEALAQTGGILALNTVPDPENYDTYFLKMDKVKFKQLVRPGDQLVLRMELLSPIKRGIVHMQGTAFVGNTVVSEGELTARIIKRQTDA